MDRRRAGVMASLVLSTSFLLAACLSMPTSTLQDRFANTTGTKSLGYLDVLSAGVQIVGDRYNLQVQTNAALPTIIEMAGEKRIDFVFFVAADRNRQTGQSENGNDYNVHMYYDETGWHPSFYKVSPVAEKDGVTLSMADFRVEAGGAEAPYFARLFFAAQYVPYDSFEWWVVGATLNAPEWLPYTENPATARARFSRQ